jgi:phospholipid-translocating ATPase
MLKEAVDDFKRFSRDKEMNNKKHEILGANGQVRVISSKDLKVGQIVKVSHNERVPADLLLIYTTERTGSVFIRTDQLDGETDWKLRKAVGMTQKVRPPQDIVNIRAHVRTLPPNEFIYDFKGYMLDEDTQHKEPLSLDNTLWANTVLASTGFIWGLVLYTGIETRAQMNSKMPRSKVGLID